MPYLDEGKNCFRCQHLGASEDGYICNKGFQNFRGSQGTRTIWTGELALICPLYEERAYAPLELEAGAETPQIEAPAT